jgi:hypothetical protein
MSHEVVEQGEETMTPSIDQQVNLQELQRLNDAITMTFEAIRRVAPQLQLLQQQALWAAQPQQQLGFNFGVPPWAQQGAQLGAQFGGQPYGMPQHQMPFYGQPFGQSVGQPFGQPFGQSVGQPFGQSPLFGVQPSIFGQSPVVGQPYYGMPINAYPQQFQPRF